jgi:hypothetical protein
MKVPAITVLMIGFAVATTAAAEGTSSGKAASPGASSKNQLSEIRSLTHELQGHTEKLRDLMTQYRAHLEQRPQPEGTGPEAKKAHEEQLARWDAALERLLRRIDAARASVVDTKQRLDQAATGQLPTALAKDVANAKNEAEAERTAAEQALAKSKPSRKKAAKPPPAEKPAPPLPADLDL